MNCCNSMTLTRILNETSSITKLYIDLTRKEFGVSGTDDNPAESSP